MVGFPSSSAEACTCGRQVTLREAWEWSDLAFLGTAISCEAPGFRKYVIGADTTEIVSGGDMVRWEFKLDRVWKGPRGETITVYSRRDSAACGIPFEIGKKYIVFANYRGEFSLMGPSLWPDSTSFPVPVAGLCGGTREHDGSGADLTELHPPLAEYPEQ
jgi:hypothetical protein